jgi:hypothetical protein
MGEELFNSVFLLEFPVWAFFPEKLRLERHFGQFVEIFQILTVGLSD